MVSQSKRDYLARIKDRYRHAGRRHKKIILDEFCAVCAHHRKHAIRLLNQDGRRKRKKPGRPGRFRAEDIQVLEDIWLNADRPCSSRLVGTIPAWLPFYEKRHGDLEDSVREMLLNAKPRTLDRVLRPIRRKHGSRGLTGTRSGEYLKHSIPIKISHGDVDRPGHMQADTVAHCGESMEGNFVWSLTFTDILTGWTENGAVWNKGEYGVRKLLEKMEEALPFALRGVHTDNGGEFINHHLERYYRKRKSPVEMTRGRPGRKNDCPHVEQKNYTHVRCLLGYRRIEDESLVKAINELYAAANLLNNFFCANRRMIFKERRGSRLYKKYDSAATPCDRLLASEHVTQLQKNWLLEVKLNLDPYKLRAMIDAKQRFIFGKLR